MTRNLSIKTTAIVAVMCIVVALCLLSGCADINDKKAQIYMNGYMDAIPITCSEYKLVELDESDHELYTWGYSANVMIAGEEKKIKIKHNGIKNYTLIIDEEAIKINKEFMAEKSAEYVTISEMWFRYDDEMENYCDIIPDYGVVGFDNSLFIVTRFRQGGNQYRFRYRGSMPACLFKYDIENDTVLYAGYLINDRMKGEYRIVRTD